MNTTRVHIQLSGSLVGSLRLSCLSHDSALAPIFFIFRMTVTFKHFPQGPDQGLLISKAAANTTNDVGGHPVLGRGPTAGILLMRRARSLGTFDTVISSLGTMISM
jgi:hypothetical protein